MAHNLERIVNCIIITKRSMDFTLDYEFAETAAELDEFAQSALSNGDEIIFAGRVSAEFEYSLSVKRVEKTPK